MPELAGTLEDVVILAGSLEEAPGEGPMTRPIRCYKGQSKTLRVTVVDGDGERFNLTGSTVYFTVRESAGGDTAILSKVTGSGITLLDQDEDETVGQVDIAIAAGDFETTDAKFYVFDVWVKKADNSQHVVVEASDLELRAAVTVVP